MYEQRNFIYDRLNAIPGISTVKPHAAFYIFPKIDRNMYNIEDDEQFVLDFLRKEKVLVTHGRSFNIDTPDHFRIVYLPDIETLSIVCDRLERFLQGYRK